MIVKDSTDRYKWVCTILLSFWIFNTIINYGEKIHKLVKNMKGEIR